MGEVIDDSSTKGNGRHESFDNKTTPTTENSRIKLKTQEKTQKLKEKTQNVGTFKIQGCRKSAQTISL